MSNSHTCQQEICKFEEARLSVPYWSSPLIRRAKPPSYLKASVGKEAMEVRIFG